MAVVTSMRFNDAHISALSVEQSGKDSAYWADLKAAWIQQFIKLEVQCDRVRNTEPHRSLSEGTL